MGPSALPPRSPSPATPLSNARDPVASPPSGGGAGWRHGGASDDLLAAHAEMERENRALREQVRMLHDRLRVAQEGVASGPSHDHDHDHDNNHDHGNDHDHDHDNDNGNDHDTDTDTDSDDDSDDDDSGSGSGEPRYVNPFAPRGQGVGGRGHGAGSVDSEASPARPREHFPNFDDAFATVSEQMCGRLDESIDFIAHTNPADISEVRGAWLCLRVCAAV